MKLCVTPNGRYLSWEDGVPFFYLADTAWELFHRLTLDEIRHYLDVRAEQGFTVIQAVCLAELDGLNAPNRLGLRPLIDNNPNTPNEAYFDFIDQICDEAAERALAIALLPTWGDKIVKAWGTGPVVFNPQNAYRYGQYLGDRFKETPNIIWVNGGDRKPTTPDEAETFRALARGIRETDPDHLITFHPQGGHSSSEDFHGEPWLDFNMIQSGHHARGIDHAEKVRRDYALSPIKPTLDAEPCYENHPINWKPDTSRFRDDDVRNALYRSVFAGACGVTYGCQDVWQFFDPAQNPPIAFADTHWREALQFAGAWQVQHLKLLMEERDFTTGKPAQARFVDAFGGAVATEGDGYLLCYLPRGETVTLRLDGLGMDEVAVSYFCPRTGIAIDDDVIEAEGEVTFMAPTNGRHNDWVLCLDAVTESE